jgi:hypothetical protein
MINRDYIGYNVKNMKSWGWHQLKFQRINHAAYVR